MKICQQGIYDAKPVARIDKYVRLASAGLYAISARAIRRVLRCILQCANRGCSDGYHAPPLRLRQVDRPRRLRRNLAPFPMQLVIFHFFYSYRLKRSQPDVQRNLGNFNPAGTNSIEDLRREVQAGRRRRDRSPCLRVYSLVAIPVRRPVVIAVNVGWKRHMSNAFDAGKEIGDRGESDAPLPKTAPFRHLGFQFGWGVGQRARWPAKGEFFPNSDLPPRPHQALPLIRIVSQLAGQHKLHSSAEKISCRWVVRAQGLGPLSDAVDVEQGEEKSRDTQEQHVDPP